MKCYLLKESDLQHLQELVTDHPIFLLCPEGQREITEKHRSQAREQIIAIVESWIEGVSQS